MSHFHSRIEFKDNLLNFGLSENISFAHHANQISVQTISIYRNEKKKQNVITSNTHTFC